MRCVCRSVELTLHELQSELGRAGAKNISVVQFSKQIFFDIDEAALDRVKSLPGVVVRVPGQTSVTNRRTGRGAWLPEVAKPVPALLPAYSGYVDSVASMIWRVRNIISPPVTGAGFTLAVLDTGIRETHRSLFGKVVYKENFSAAASTDDIFDHGTGVAYVAAGGRAVEGEEQGIAPGANLMNMKVLDDNGDGRVEDIVQAIERCINLRSTHDPLDPLFPNLINMSLGTPDDGDPENPLRVAVEASVKDNLLGCVCAAGNGGPGAGTIILPGASYWADAIGAMTYDFSVWQYSSRGPTKDGLVKPDLMWFGVDRIVASSKSDDAYAAKSGTSFSAPAIAGFGILAREYWVRAMGAQWTEMSLEQIYAMYPMISRKPQGAPAAKDNDYGFGMPFGDLFVQAVSPGVSSMITPAMSMMFMAIMMKSVLGGML